MDPYEFVKDACKWGKKLGKGNFGEVYEVEYHGQKYAGKLIPKMKLMTEDDVKYLEGEIEILKKMSSCENSVKLYYNYKDDGDEILILELCDCELTDILNHSKGFDPSQIYEVMSGLNNAFRYMNQSEIIHRDIKLENIMIKYTDASHTKFIPKINDYGVSRTLTKGLASTFCGSPLYMAPEVIMKKPYTDKADLWSIGVLIYMMHFKEIPFAMMSLDFNGYIQESDVRKMLDKKKRRDAEDKQLDDLMNRLLTYDPEQRISWNDYLNHPFFNKTIKDTKKDQKGFVVKIIKLYDWVIEKMVLYNYIEKENLEKLKNIPGYKDEILSVNEALNSNDGQYFILGVLGKYLEKVGIRAVIEKEGKKKNTVQELNYVKTFLQLMCNGFILKKRYIFDFALDNKRIRQLVGDDIDKCQFNEKLRNKLITAYNLREDEILVTNYKTDKNYFSSIVIFKSDFNKDFNLNELLNLFNDEKELKTLSKVEKQFVIPNVRFMKYMLEPRGNNVGDKKWGINEKRGGEPYIPPIGWHKYGLRVYDRYDNKNNDWLGYQNKPGEWCTGYCPVTGINKKIEQTYEDDDDIKHPGKKVGVGVYCTPQPKTMEDSTEEIDINGSKYKIGFMIRLHPNRIRCPKSKNDIWVVNGNDDEFRPYGILIKKTS